MCWSERFEYAFLSQHEALLDQMGSEADSTETAAEETCKGVALHRTKTEGRLNGGLNGRLNPFK